MTTTISRLYNNYGDARAAVQQLEAGGVAHNDISIIASNADNWYGKGGKDSFPDRVVASGWLVATLAGAAAGGATGGALGALTQAGISNEEADVYAEGLRRGGAVVSVRVADSDAARLQAVMDRSAVRVADRAAAYRKSGWKAFDPNATPYDADQVKRERSLYM